MSVDTIALNKTGGSCGVSSSMHHKCKFADWGI